jgi:hypothetical protein
VDASKRDRRELPAVRINSADPFMVDAGGTARSTPGVPTVTNEQRQVLRLVHDTGGNVHRNAIPRRMLGALVVSRLLMPFGSGRVELTTLGSQLLADGDEHGPESTA